MDTRKSKKPPSRTSCKQFWICAGVFMSWFSEGNILGFSAVLIPQLRNESRFDLDNNVDMESWITSIIGFGTILGSIVMPGLMSKYGRKPANIISLIITGLGWLLLTIANNLVVIIIARFLNGLGMGLVSIVSGITLAECVSPSKRGYCSVLCLTGAFGFGVIFIHLSGLLLHWKIVSGLSCIFLMLGILIFIKLPETPFWLASKGRYDESRDSFHSFRGYNEKAESELEKMISARILENQRKEPQPTLVSDLKKVILSLGKKELLKPLIISIHLFGLTQICGSNVFQSYAIDIINQLLSGKKINMTLFLTTVDILRQIALLISVVLIKYFTRRNVLYLSSLFSMFSMLSLALCSYIQSLYTFDCSWIGILLISIYAFSTGLGVVSLPFAIIAEIFPMKVKGIGNCIGAVALDIIMFSTLKTAPYLMKMSGLHGLYFIYSGIMAYCLVVIWFTLPETKGRTLQEIEEEFQKVKLTFVPSKHIENE